ncbi:MAG: hypothetical protein ACLT8E_01280 [Akkermansia sp.]
MTTTSYSPAVTIPPASSTPWGAVCYSYDIRGRKTAVQHRHPAGLLRLRRSRHMVSLTTFGQMGNIHFRSLRPY